MTLASKTRIFGTFSLRNANNLGKKSLLNISISEYALLIRMLSQRITYLFFKYRNK